MKRLASLNIGADLHATDIALLSLTSMDFMQSLQKVVEIPHEEIRADKRAGMVTHLRRLQEATASAIKSLEGSR